jgi:hypothetical protein
MYGERVASGLTSLTLSERRRLCAAVIALVVGMLAVCTVTAQSPGATEYQVKAVYLYNFGRFVAWPVSAPASESFSICVLGHDPFGQILDTTLTGLSIDSKAVTVHRLTAPEEATRCRIVFISESEAPHLKETLAALEKSSVLTVSDIPQFAQRGGVIEFVLAGNRVRFEINLTIAQSEGLVLSSDLLKVAIAVRKSVNTGD